LPFWDFANYRIFFQKFQALMECLADDDLTAFVNRHDTVHARFFRGFTPASCAFSMKGGLDAASESAPALAPGGINPHGGLA